MLVSRNVRTMLIQVGYFTEAAKLCQHIPDYECSMWNGTLGSAQNLPQHPDKSDYSQDAAEGQQSEKNQKRGQTYPETRPRELQSLIFRARTLVHCQSCSLKAGLSGAIQRTTAR